MIQKEIKLCLRRSIAATAYVSAELIVGNSVRVNSIVTAERPEGCDFEQEDNSSYKRSSKIIPPISQSNRNSKNGKFDIRTEIPLRISKLVSLDGVL